MIHSMLRRYEPFFSLLENASFTPVFLLQHSSMPPSLIVLHVHLLPISPLFFTFFSSQHHSSLSHYLPFPLPPSFSPSILSFPTTNPDNTVWRWQLSLRPHHTATRDSCASVRHCRRSWRRGVLCSKRTNRLVGYV